MPLLEKAEVPGSVTAIGSRAAPEMAARDCSKDAHAKLAVLVN